MSITGISESKWFGQGMYNVDGFVMIHSGRLLPRGDDPVLRNKGVGIVMNPVVAAAWRDSGERWKAKSSRIVYAPVQYVPQDVYVFVVSVYASTYHSPEE